MIIGFINHQCIFIAQCKEIRISVYASSQGRYGDRQIGLAQTVVTYNSKGGIAFGLFDFIFKLTQVFDDTRATPRFAGDAGITPV